MRRPFEKGFARSFKDVRVVSNSKAARIAEQLDARALTVGQHIWFGRGEFRPDTMKGRRLLAHELVHTVQQSSGSRALQKDLAIGASSDSAEVEADKVADAVVSGERGPSIQQRPSLLRREVRQSCRVSSTPRPYQRMVECGRQRYRVTIYFSSSRQPQTQAAANLGWNDNAIWLNIDICRGGTAVNIRPTVNLPQALVDVVGNLLGGSDALQGVTLTPELRITIVQSRNYSISLSGGPTVEPGTGQVTGGRGGISVDTSSGRYGLDVSGTGQSLTVSVSVTPGDFRPESRDCSTTRRRLEMRCERITVTRAVPATPAVYRTSRREVYLLFPYAQSSPVRRVLMGEDGGRPRASNDSEVRTLGDQGYQVQSVEGFASPEGPRPQSQRRRFIGNDQLSQNRASQAQRWFETNCPNCGGQAVAPIGRSELYSPGQTPELEGDPLTRHATPEFLSGDPLRPETEQERQRLGQASLQTQRDSVYPLLRRAYIVLTRPVEVQAAQPGSPRREDSDNVPCPPEVRQAVRRHFRISALS